jgi:hypothetical protein
MNSIRIAKVGVLIFVLAGCGVGTGGAGGAGSGGQGAGAQGCTRTSDCPASNVVCFETACVGGICGETPIEAGKACSAKGTCDGSGQCLECQRDTDCADSSANEECVAVSCQNGSCYETAKATTTKCNGGLCDGSGQCQSQCSQDTDCMSAAACNVPVCVEGACEQKPGPDGTACNWNDLPIATCNAGDCRVCEDTACGTLDTHESNDTQATATDLGAHTDCEHYGFCASLTDGDVDWYTYQGSDTFGCNVAPSVDFDAPNLEVCQYWSCDSVPTVSTCPDGTTPDVAPGGQPGCCSKKPFSYDPCNGGIFDSEDAHVWIKVTRSQGSGCEPYALGVEF